MLPHHCSHRTLCPSRVRLSPPCTHDPVPTILPVDGRTTSKIWQIKEWMKSKHLATLWTWHSLMFWCWMAVEQLVKLCVCVYAKSLQLCTTPHDPMDCSPPGSSVHGISPGKNSRVGYHSLLQGIFQTQGSNLCLLNLLHWQAGSFPLAPPGKHYVHVPMSQFPISPLKRRNCFPLLHTWMLFRI